MLNEEDKESHLTKETTSLTSISSSSSASSSASSSLSSSAKADEDGTNINYEDKKIKNDVSGEKQMGDKKLQEQLSTKEAYFLSLNEWVKHANIAQNAMALFPWYLINTYPQIFQQQQQQQLQQHEQQANAFAALVAALWGIVPPIQSMESGQAMQSPQQSTATGINNQPMSLNNDLDDSSDSGSGSGSGTGSGLGIDGIINNDNQDIGVGATTAATAAVALFLNRTGDDSVNSATFRILSEQSQIELINITGGYEYTIAPFWKRAIAELIDALILLSIKMVFIFITMTLFDFEFGFTFDMDKDMFGRMMQREEYYGLISIVDMLSFSTNLLFVEIIIKLLVCFYEAACTAWFNGATPGKAVMGLTIKYIEALHVLQPPPLLQFPQHPIQLSLQQARMELRAILYPAETPSFMRALLRSFAKTMIISMLFPMCFIMFFFRNNRTAYDFVTKTIVVIQPRQPPPFRRDIR